MKQSSLPISLLMLLLLQAPALAVPMPFSGIGNALRNMPMWGSNSEGEPEPRVELYELPAPQTIEEVSEPAPTVAAKDQTDPLATWMWAHSVDISTVKRSDLYQYGNAVRNVLAMRKLRAVGYLPPVSGSLVNLDGLTDKGKNLQTQLGRSEVQSLLATIRFAEGTLRDSGYNTGFGFVHISDLSRHPMTVWQGSSAAGAYQFMNYTWPGVSQALGLKDFTPLSQDLAALHQMVYKHGIDLNSYTDADFNRVINKLAPEWASLPMPNGNSKYMFRGRPQPARSMASLWNVYQAARGGTLPKMGYDSFHWNDQAHTALATFQADYEVQSSGDFDDETYLALFDGQFGTAGVSTVAVVPAPVVETSGFSQAIETEGGFQRYVPAPEPAPEPALTPEVVAEVIDSYMSVSPHNIVPVSGGEVIGGYRVTSKFGPRKSPCSGCSSFHPAWDLATPIGTPVYAPFDGIEVKHFYTRGAGNVARFTYDGMEFSLLHMKSVAPGGYEKGWVMGYTGNTGNGTGPHLDIRVRQNGQWVLPSREVVHFMLDPTAFRNHVPDPAPLVEEVAPAAAPTDEVQQDAIEDAPRMIVQEEAPGGFFSFFNRFRK
jgi:murein DD-endopeptidase MepM/ murein hydrolase activator NlpD/muramidase (phage lysozyme)